MLIFTLIREGFKIHKYKEIFQTMMEGGDGVDIRKKMIVKSGSDEVN